MTYFYKPIYVEGRTISNVDENITSNYNYKFKKNYNNFQHFKVHAVQSFTKKIFRKNKISMLRLISFCSIEQTEDSQLTLIPLNFIHNLSYTDITGIMPLIYCAARLCIFSRVNLLVVSSRLI